MSCGRLPLAWMAVRISRPTQVASISGVAATARAGLSPPG